jgi:ADP-heptose:LPS heptosyltransferase
VGDSVMALPFLTACKQENPESTLLVICKSWVAPIFENNPFVEGIVSFQKKDLSGYRSTHSSGQSLRALDLDYFIYCLILFVQLIWLINRNQFNG